MRNLKEIATLAGFPEEAVEFFATLYEKAENIAEAKALLKDAEKVYFEGGNVDEYLEKLPELMGEHRYSTDMLFLLYCAVPLKEIYKEKGYTEEMYIGVLSDLKYKGVECHDVHGVWGTFVFSWFHRFYLCTRFSLGRLQYEIIKSEVNYKDKAKVGDEIINCHIPSSGKMTPELVQDSFKKAYEFYGFKGEMVVQCHSWMLYPPYAEAGVFPEGTNLRYFYDLFDVVETSYRDFGSSSWRVFGTLEKDISKLPRDTGLRKRLCEFYEKGNGEGVGRGILVYKP